MTLPTHIVMGLIVGKVTGNYTLAVGSSLVPDLDHFYSYFKSGVIRSPKKFWQTVMDQSDPYGDQRGVLHNILIPILILPFNVVMAIGWLGHLVLDALDRSEYWPFYPNKRLSLRGFIKYASRQELVFVFFLMTLYFIL